MFQYILDIFIHQWYQKANRMHTIRFLSKETIDSFSLPTIFATSARQHSTNSTQPPSLPTISTCVRTNFQVPVSNFLVQPQAVQPMQKTSVLCLFSPLEQVPRADHCLFLLTYRLFDLNDCQSVQAKLDSRRLPWSEKGLF